MPLPTVGQPDWGGDLNDFLEVGHTASGSLRLGWGPEHYGLQLWTEDWGHGNIDYSFQVGSLDLFRVNLDRVRTVADFCFYALGPTDPESISAFFGIYGPTGTLIAKTADQKTDLLTDGLKQYALTAEAGQSLTLTQPWVYLATLLGDGGSTPNVAAIDEGGALGLPTNAFLQPADGFRVGYFGDGTLTTMPSTIDVEDVEAATTIVLLGLR